MRRMVAGERVRVRKLFSGDEWAYGTVEIISDNGKSAALRIEGVVRAAGTGFIAGVLPLLLDEEKGVALGLEGTEYEVEVKA